MILTDRIAQAVAAGEVDVAFRRWRQPRVSAGSTFRTVAGLVRIDDIDAALDRMDARTPWARATLERIGEQPGITASELAVGLPIDKESLKRRIRRLKENGLTFSLPSGYELTPRGRAYLRVAGSETSEPG